MTLQDAIQFVNAFQVIDKMDLPYDTRFALKAVLEKEFNEELNFDKEPKCTGSMPYEVSIARGTFPYLYQQGEKNLDFAAEIMARRTDISHRDAWYMLAKEIGHIPIEE